MDDVVENIVEIVNATESGQDDSIVKENIEMIDDIIKDLGLSST